MARRNLIFSIFSEHIGFSVWVIWSVSAALMTKAGFTFSVSQLFWLVAVPNLVGSLLRLPYTFAVPKFGGRNWTVISALMLLIPTGLFAFFVQRPDTPFWVFLLISVTAGFGGGNFASSMTNINTFYPAAQKGTALGLNAAGGNAGVAVIQFALPIVVGAGGGFGAFAAAKSIHLEYAGYIGVALALVSALCAYLFMDNLHAAAIKPRQQMSVIKYKDTWVMAFLYIGTFGSFIGYSSAMPLLIKLNFFRQIVPAAHSIGINFAFYAFLGAAIGSLTRPIGGWLADKFTGAKVTLAAFGAMILGTLGVITTLMQLHPLKAPTAALIAKAKADPKAFEYPAKVVHLVNENSGVFPWFLVAFLFVFAATGIANGSAYKMIPAIWKAKKRPVTEASAVLGVVGAAGALGGFLIPITFNAPWVTNPFSATKVAFWIFTGFYVVCAVVTWAYFLTKRSKLAAFDI
ncbi:MAG: MFS transporter [Marmoricola sp.]